jgi:hypothetical protein
MAVNIGASNIRFMAGLFDYGRVSCPEIQRFEHEFQEFQGQEFWNMEAIASGIIDGLLKVISEFGNEIISMGVYS